MEPYHPPQTPWLHILYQDAHIIAVNKLSGLLSVPGRALEHKDSVMTRIQADFPQAEAVHRLDMATSGVLTVGLTKAAERELKRQFREREPRKTYIARVRLTPLTGRSHQLRVHMQSLGHPILGEGFYATPAAKAMAPWLLLHAKLWPSPILITTRRFISIERLIFKLNRRSCFATAANAGHDMPNLGAPCPAHPGAAFARRLALDVIYRLAKALFPL